MNCFVFLFLLFSPSFLRAEEVSGVVGIGDIASNLKEPVIIVSQFVATGSIIIGACCLFSALLRYMQHRINPLAFPISTIILLVVMGVALIFLPMIHQLTEHGVPFNYF